VRVLLITQLFQPEPNHLKGLDYAKAVRRAGIDLRVLTGFPNYPGGRLYPGYAIRPLMQENLEGVPVTRVAMYPSHDRSAIRRAATYSTFMASAVVAVCAGRFRPDVVHAYLGPITLAVPSVAAKGVRGSRVLLDVQDLWPESATASGMGRRAPVDGALGRLSRWAYRTSDRIVVLSQGYERALRARGVAADRIEVVHNWCDESQVPPRTHGAGPPSSAPGCLRIVYAGNIGTVQALDVVLDAASLVNAARTQVEFVIAGSGVEEGRLRARVAAEGILGVRLLGRVPAAQMSAVYRQADALLVHLRDTPLSRVAIPQKTQMCLAAGRPVLMGVAGEASDLVLRAGGGVVFQPENPRSLACAVEELVAMGECSRLAMGDRARQFYERELSFDRGVRAMIAAYEATADSHR
jgi:glycosyltransferase involved in cell wall biosynthesis